MSNANWKPWWEQVASFGNDKDQEEFLRGAYQGMQYIRPTQRSAYLMGLVAGYNNRTFEQPKPHTGKP